MAILTPDDPNLQALRRKLFAKSQAHPPWPQEQLRWLADEGVFAWFAPKSHGGAEWDEASILQGYMELAHGCFTTAFVLTQLSGAMRRFAAGNHSRKDEWLPLLARGDRYSSIGFSHVTTSQRHLGAEPLSLERSGSGWTMSGVTNWVTGAKHCSFLTVGVMDEGSLRWFAVDCSDRQVEIEPPMSLMALTGSDTSRVRFHRVLVSESDLVFRDMDQAKQRTSTGGLQTSAVAVGLASAAIEFLETEAIKRRNLADPCDALRAERDRLRTRILDSVETAAATTLHEIRSQANSLVLRAAQAALAAAKGAGYVSGHHAERWCREAMFFLVWSCPQEVVDASLCELSRLESD